MMRKAESRYGTSRDLLLYAASAVVRRLVAEGMSEAAACQAVAAALGLGAASIGRSVGPAIIACEAARQRRGGGDDE